MGTKVTSSSGSVLKEPEIQKLQMQAKIFKENSLNKLNALKSTTQLLEKQSILYQQAFAQLFETLHEMDSKSASTIAIPTVQGSRGSIFGYKTGDETSQWMYQMKRLKRRNWKHITVSWQRFRKSYLQNQVLLIPPIKEHEVTCSYLHSRPDLNANTELTMPLYLLKSKNVNVLAQKLRRNKLNLTDEKQHSLQDLKASNVFRKEEKASNVFRKEHEQYHEIQDLKAQMQYKYIAISEFKELIETAREISGNSV
ncbi:hypothetical protein Tco_0724533 [Tanacetum coccineum]